MSHFQCLGLLSLLRPASRGKNAALKKNQVHVIIQRNPAREHLYIEYNNSSKQKERQEIRDKR